MSNEILINITPQETRVAVMEQGVVQELHIERVSSFGIVGNIYSGRVSRILPGMQSAFIDIGLDRAAFLQALEVLYTCLRLSIAWAWSRSTTSQRISMPVKRL